MFDQLQHTLLSWAETLPLEIFVLVASFVEEIIAPIPSFTVMILAGTLAFMQEHTLQFLFVLAALGAIGKVCGALLVYYIADYAEDFVLGSGKSFFGVSHTDVEGLGKRLSHGTRDYVIMTALRAAPFIPSVLLSAGSGILKIPLTLFLVSTFVGTVIRDLLYLYAGYVGLDVLTNVIETLSHVESYILYGCAGSVCLAILWLRFCRRGGRITEHQ